MTAPLPLYGDLLNGILFPITLPHLALQIYEAFTGKDLVGGGYFPPFLWVSTAILVYCSWNAFYFSRLDYNGVMTEAVNDDKISSAFKRYHFVWRDVRYECRPSRVWSYCAYSCLLVSTAGVTLLNWPHTNQPVMLALVVWHLVVATANVSHTLWVKVVMGVANWAGGMVVIWAWPQLYPWYDYAPKLMAVTAVYLLAQYWISSGGRITELDLISLLQPECAHQSNVHGATNRTLPSAVAPTVPPTKLSSLLPLLTWDNALSHLAFGFVSCFFVYFSVYEVRHIMADPSYTAATMLNICQTGVLGAAGWIVSTSLRQSENEVENIESDGEAALSLASMAFQTSPTPMVITNGKRFVEERNAAFAHFVTHSADPVHTRRGATKLHENESLDVVLGLSTADAGRLQHCFDRAIAFDADEIHESASDDFSVDHRVICLSVSPDLTSGWQEATSPLSWFGLLTGNASRRRPRLMVVLQDVTLDRALARALHESTMLQGTRQTDALVRQMRDQISTAMRT